MEFITDRTGVVIPDPEIPITDEELASCQSAMDFFRGNAEHIKRFKGRVEELGRSGQDTIITLINVNDQTGAILADVLMPGVDWQRYRDAGEIPVARGLAGKDGIPDFLQEAGYPLAASDLLNTDDLMVVVLDAGVALVLNVDFDVES